MPSHFYLKAFLLLLALASGSAQTSREVAPSNKKEKGDETNTTDGSLVPSVVTVESRLDFGFFRGYGPDKPPKRAEINSLLEQTSAFYTEALQVYFPNSFDKFEAKLVSSSFDRNENSSFPVAVDFTATASFLEGFPAPSQQTLFESLENADYETYIIQYVWKSATDANGNTGTFFDTQRVEYSALEELSDITQDPDHTGSPTQDFTLSPGTSEAPTEDATMTISPGGSEAPTEGCATMTPTNSDEPQVQLVVESQIEYGFFAGVEVHEPTQEELEELMKQTQMFYESLFTDAYSSQFVEVTIKYLDFVFDEGANLPILVNFDAVVNFLDSGLVAIPTAAELFDVMESADYQDYITQYVWSTGPGLFFDTQVVAFNARGPGGPPAPPGQEVQVLVESQIEYGFFAGVEVHEPTQEELEELMKQTQMFYESLFTDAYSSQFVEVTIEYIDFVFDEGANLPILVNFDAVVIFLDNGLVTIPTAAEVFDVMESADYQAYITQYVWSTGPGLFFDTQVVAFNARGPGGPPAPPGQEVQVLVESQIEYGFFAGVEVREPTQVELKKLTKQTQMFYESLFTAAYSSQFVHVTIKYIDFVFDEGANLPILVNFDAVVIFLDSGLVAIPTAAEVFSVMESADYQAYITQYVWSTGPGLFFDTQETTFNARSTTLLGKASVNRSGASLEKRDSNSKEDSKIHAVADRPGGYGIATAPVNRSGNELSDSTISKNDMTTQTVVIPTRMHFNFFPGTGVALEDGTMMKLLTRSSDFVRNIFSRDGSSISASSLVDITMESVSDPKYDMTGSLDSFEISFDTKVELNSGSLVTERQVLNKLSSANWNHYVSKYVHQEEEGATTPLNDIRKVVFRGVAKSGAGAPL